MRWHLAFWVISALLCGRGYCTLLDCSNACQTPLARVRFNGSSDDQGNYVKQCTNLLQVRSIYSCMRVYCNLAEISTGLIEMQLSCRKYGFVELLPWSVIDNISFGDAERWPRLKHVDLSNFVIYNSPVYVEQSLFMLALRSATAWNRSEITRMNYGFAMIIFFAVVLSMSMFARIINYLEKSRLLPSYAKTNSRSPFSRSIRLALKRYITTPALATHCVAQPIGWCTVPQRIQSLTIGAFIVVNIVLCCISYDLFEDNLNWPTIAAQFWRYFSDRTGVISLANLPLIFAFGMRNNVLFWLTGWSFPTFNLFHRWVARVATIEAILHSIGYTIECFLDGGKDAYLAQWTQNYWQLGVIATIAMSLICGFSVLPLRQYYYELFLVVHIVLAIVFLIGMWYHVVMFGSQYTTFIWPCVAVWMLDRLLRFGRIVMLNKASLVGTATYCGNANLIRIKIPIRSSSPPQPGTYYYIYGIGTIRFWESHPFTLSTWKSSLNNKTQHVLTFLIRPYDSYTARLRDSLKHSWTAQLSTAPYTSKSNVRVVVEGPYGQPHTLSRYNSILFVVGGTGITVALSHLQNLYETMADHNIPVRRIHLVWIVRDATLYQDVYQHELSGWLNASSLTKKAYFQLDVHVTGHKALKHSSNSSSIQTTIVERLEAGNASSETPLLADNSKSGLFYTVVEEEGKCSTRSLAPVSSAHISVAYSKPSIKDIVLGAADNWCTAGDRLAVVCCGPAGMADDTRAAVVLAYARGYEGLDLHSETFTW